MDPTDLFELTLSASSQLHWASPHPYACSAVLEAFWTENGKGIIIKSHNTILEEQASSVAQRIAIFGVTPYPASTVVFFSLFQYLVISCTSSAKQICFGLSHYH